LAALANVIRIDDNCQHGRLRDGIKRFAQINSIEFEIMDAVWKAGEETVTDIS
jgi:hypothetical protein